ncbi:hypothetical protein O1611_g10319 [Lasiodiplodia mahajangana]|uniref:Uncharacterized protein n=1 Tax=Lasiodiplodia mahajangana TaxID=1108764 RepID=A0ACC2J0B5_9PEZI|nr:hypothetical protein O1611_g10319 [Lasiodiplodia mahajangana]
MLFTFLLSLLAFTGHATAVSWYFLRYYPASGQKFTSFSGTMTIPTQPNAATIYVWPGLQPTDNSGVYQNVLDGRSGTWWIGSGWCCANPSLPWGSGFNTYPGETVKFTNTLGSSAWTSTLTRSSTGETVSNSFALSMIMLDPATFTHARFMHTDDTARLASKSFNQALFAIELYDVAWNFGQVVFSNVVITSTGSSDSSWCNTTPENYNSATVYSITGVSASVSGSTVTCKIASVVLQRPA